MRFKIGKNGNGACGVVPHYRYGLDLRIIPVIGFLRVNLMKSLIV